MQEIKLSILSTRPLGASLVSEAKAACIAIDELPFIETDPVRTFEIQQEIAQAFQHSSVVVFTSMNAVEAVVALQNGKQPDWKIYCTGQSTQQLISQHLGTGLIAGTADSAADLAGLIAEKMNGGKLLFFCGNLRRDELPDILREKGIITHEIVVYKTTWLPHKIGKTYQGILFYSPSAVDSFFSNNTLSGQTVLFAIGKTTAAAIKQYCNNKIIISREPGKESLVREMIRFFS